jgi:hypothetical protein
MEDNAMPKRILKERLYSKRRKGRPRMRWLDDVESGLKKMEVKGWKEKMRDREQWRLAVEQCFSTFMRPRASKFFFYKTRAQSQQIYS